MTQNQDHSEETAQTGEADIPPVVPPRSASREKGPRKVAKTMLFNQPAPQKTEESERPGRRKVAKTLLFKTDFVSETTKPIGQDTTDKVEDIDNTDLDDYFEETLSALTLEEKSNKKEKPRKVKKTLLEADLGDLVSSPESLKPPASEEKAENQPRKIKKTLLEAEMGDLLSSPESLTSQPSTDQAPEPASPAPGTYGGQPQTPEQPLSHQEIEPPAQIQEQPPSPVETSAPSEGQAPTTPRRYVAKTKLDHSILYDTVIKAAEKLEQQATEQAKQKALEPVKTFVPVTAKKKAMACHWSWNDPEPCEKFQYCGICQTPIYNFNDMELPEAEALIFQRENLKKPTLYKRHDGKFMTKDCPVAVKRQKDTITYTLIGLAVTAAILFVLATLPPPPKPPTPVITETAPPPPPTTPTNPTTGAQPGTSSDGSFHYEGGKITTQPIAPPPEPVAPPPPTRQEETGEFWQFPAGQNQ